MKRNASSISVDTTLHHNLLHVSQTLGIAWPTNVVDGKKALKAVLLPKKQKLSSYVREEDLSSSCTLWVDSENFLQCWKLAEIKDQVCVLVTPPLIDGNFENTACKTLMFEKDQTSKTLCFLPSLYKSTWLPQNLLSKQVSVQILLYFKKGIQKLSQNTATNTFLAKLGTFLQNYGRLDPIETERVPSPSLKNTFAHFHLANILCHYHSTPLDDSKTRRQHSVFLFFAFQLFGSFLKGNVLNCFLLKSFKGNERKLQTIFTKKINVEKDALNITQWDTFLYMLIAQAIKELPLTHDEVKGMQKQTSFDDETREKILQCATGFQNLYEGLQFFLETQAVSATNQAKILAEINSISLNYFRLFTPCSFTDCFEEDGLNCKKSSTQSKPVVGILLKELFTPFQNAIQEIPTNFYSSRSYQVLKSVKLDAQKRASLQDGTWVLDNKIAMHFLDSCKFIFYSALEILPSKNIFEKLNELCSSEQFSSTFPDEILNYRKIVASGMCLLQLSGGFRVGEILDTSCIVFPSCKSDKNRMMIMGMSKKNDMESKQNSSFERLQETTLRYDETKNFEEVEAIAEECCEAIPNLEKIERFLLYDVSVEEIMCFRNHILFPLLNENKVTYESLVATCNNLLKTFHAQFVFKKFTRNGEACKGKFVPVSTHDLRGLYATESFKIHAPPTVKEIVWIQKVLGHSTTSFDSSLRYSRKLLM
jgi:hypothetical protein